MISRSRIVLLLFLFTLASSAYPAEINLLVFGDWGAGRTPEEVAVAKRAATYSKESDIKFDAAFLLGDNFYKEMDGGINDPRWHSEFEDLFDPQVLSMPFYAALGNHDYEGSKAIAELSYSNKHPESRWKMPNKWYRVDLPEKNPLVTVFVLDSNFAQLSEEAWKKETAWLKEQLQRKDNARWTIATAHHPLYTSGHHGDTKRLINEWGPLFKQYKLDFFLCGHDHDLQHLEMDGWPTTFLLAGGGGAKIRPMKRNDRGPFARSLNGFLHLRLGDDKAIGTFVTKDGKIPHRFSRSVAGEIETLPTTDLAQPDKDKKDKK